MPPADSVPVILGKCQTFQLTSISKIIFLICASGNEKWLLETTPNIHNSCRDTFPGLKKLVRGNGPALSRN